MLKTTLLAAFIGVSLAAAGCVTHEKEVVVEKPVAAPPQKVEVVTPPQKVEVVVPPN
jgi:hypothetical protein